MSEPDEDNFPNDVSILGEIIGDRPVTDDNEYDDARRVLRSDWLAAHDARLQAEAWDRGADAAMLVVAQDLLALLPQKRNATNPYRRTE